VTIGAYAAQPISMALHELATNATKYGALSRSGGVVAVRWRLIEAGTWLCLEWCESGGPPVPGPPVGRGFGSRVIEQTITQQLGGRIERRWAPEGLACVLEIPLRRGPEIIAARAA
jgi:two-component sensor histidine kinase